LNERWAALVSSVVDDDPDALDVGLILLLLLLDEVLDALGDGVEPGIDFVKLYFGRKVFKQFKKTFFLNYTQ
jgi:hypothetical protein